MSEETITPPPIPGESVTGFGSAEWYYVVNGVRKGPVTSAALKDTLDNKELETDAPVWRKGMSEWKSLRNSDLAHLVATEPPAVASELIGNGYAWILAVIPLIVGLFDASIAYKNNQALAWTGLTGAPYNPSSDLPWQIPFFANLIIGLFDLNRLRKAGHGRWWMGLMAVLLVPVYLFARAKRLKQRPSYAIAWIVSFVLAAIFVAAASN
jgi:hypothetical protein